MTDPSDSTLPTDNDPSTPELSETDNPTDVVASGEAVTDAEAGPSPEPGAAVEAEAAPPAAPRPPRYKPEDVAEAERWGFVDDAGNVRARASELTAERVVGQVKGAAPAALAYYVQKYREIVTKVEALEAEAAEAADKGRVLGRVERMLAWMPEANALGDLDGLIRRLHQLQAAGREQVTAFRARKQALAEQAEALADSVDWKETWETLKALQLEWKGVGPLPRDENETLWQRFRGAIDRFVERRQEHFGHLDRSRSENLAKKLDLCARAEALVESSEWKATSEAFKTLQAEWKEIGPVAKEEAEAIWERFRGACDRFFSRRDAAFGERDRDRDGNLAKKLALCERAEALVDSSDWKETTEALKVLQGEWKEIGPVPKEDADAVWERFRGACDRFFERRDQAFSRQDGERKANLKKKLALCQEAERLSMSLDFRGTATALKALQAQWKEIGPVPKEQADAVWLRFRGACDVFFNRRGAYLDDRSRQEAGGGEGKPDALERLRSSMQRDEENLARWRESLANVRPGPREQEIRTGLEAKIADVSERLAEKKQREKELEAAAG